MSYQQSNTNVSTLKQSSSNEVQSFLRLSCGIGLLGAVLFLPFSIQLPFNWMHLLFWLILICPMLLPLLKSFKKERLSAIQRVSLFFALCFQSGLALLLGLGFFWDTHQTPTNLTLQSEIPLQTIPGSDQHYTIETWDSYQVFIEGKVGPQALTYPKSKTTLHKLEAAASPMIRSFTGCSHHWVETLFNRLFDHDTHLSYQKIYQLHLPNSF